MRKRTVATVALPAILWAIFVGHATAHAENVSLGKPVSGAHYGDQVYLNQFLPGNITDGGFGDDTGSLSFWLSPQGVSDTTLTIDLQGDYVINALELQDSHNRWYYDRGTNAFTVRTSLDNVNYTTVLNDSFSHADWEYLTVRHFDIPAVNARFIQFESLSIYGGAGAGLNEFTAFGSPSAVPEIDPAGVGSIAALVTGALGLLERRRLKAA